MSEDFPDHEIVVNDQSVYVEDKEALGDQRFTFNFDDDVAWPMYFNQQGETYRANLEDTPDWIIELIEEELDVKVEER